MKLFSPVSVSRVKKLFRNGLSVFVLGSILLSSGLTSASWLSDILNGEYEDEVKIQKMLCFSDISAGTLEAEAACYLKERGIIGGFPDGEFKGKRLVNRAEISKFLLLASRKTVSDLRNEGRFPDVLEGEWYVKYVISAAKHSLVNGYPDKYFRPAKSVNTAEFLKMAVKAFNLEEGLDYQYTDVVENDWFARYVGIAEKYQLFPERTTRAIDPSKLLTRKEVAIAIYRILKPINIVLPPVADNCFVRAGGQIVKKIYADGEEACFDTLNRGGENGMNMNCAYGPDIDAMTYKVEFLYKDHVFYEIKCPWENPVGEKSCIAEVSTGMEYNSNSWKEAISKTCESFSDGCNTCRRESGSGMVMCTEMACAEYREPKCFDNDEEHIAPFYHEVVAKHEAKDKEHCKTILNHGRSNCQSYTPRNVDTYKYELRFLFDGKEFYNETCITDPAPQSKTHILKVSAIREGANIVHRETIPVPFADVTFLKIGIRNTENVPVYVKNLTFQAHGTDEAANYKGYKARLFSHQGVTSTGVHIYPGMKPSQDIVEDRGHEALGRPLGTPPVTMTSSVDKKGMVQFNQDEGFYINGNGYREFILSIDARFDTAPGTFRLDFVGARAIAAPMTMEMKKAKRITLLNGNRPLSRRNPIRGKTEKLIPLFSSSNSCHVVSSLQDCTEGMCDANQDGNVDMKDVDHMRKYIANLKETCGRNSPCNCDIDGSGSVSILDALLLSRFISESTDTDFILGPPEVNTTQ